MTSVQYIGLESASIEELLKINEEEGELRTESVVYRAKDVSNPLHKHFLWDDREAAHRHRLEQARLLITQVDVFIVAEPEKRTRAFVSLKNEEGRSFRAMTEVFESPEYLAKVRDDIRRDLKALQEKLQRFDEFSSAAALVGEAAAAL